MTEDYVYQQTVAGLSHESQNERWVEGQRRFIRYADTFLDGPCIVLDCACGDGVGMVELERLNHVPIGMDMADEKLRIARSLMFSADKGDMHNRDDYPVMKFDAVLSSHTLEHAHTPSVVVDNFRDVLHHGGFLFVVLPFPDPGDWNDAIHVGKYALGTDGDDEDRVVEFFTSRGFELVEKKRDDYREPELWLVLKKVEP